METCRPSLAHLLLPSSGQANAVVCLAQWRDSSSKGSSYDLLSAAVARLLKVEEMVAALELEQLLTVMTFLDVEKAIMRGLRDRILSTAATIDVEAIRAIATRRQDGHWASHTVPPSATVPRQALAAVYQALVAAADLFALRNRYADGFHFATAPAMYQAYETELYRLTRRIGTAVPRRIPPKPSSGMCSRRCATGRSRLRPLVSHPPDPGLGHLCRSGGEHGPPAPLADRPRAESAPVLPAACPEAAG